MTMQRRLVLTGLAALAATPALAQSNPAPQTDAPAAAAPSSPAMAPAPAPAMKVAPPLTNSDAATTHIKATLETGSLSLLISRMAAPKVRQTELRQFVGFEIAEQETIASILKTMMLPGSTPSGTVRPPTDAELAGNLDAKGKAVVAELQGMKAGVAFEKVYVKAQVEGHRTLLEIQEAYLKAPDKQDEADVAKLAKGMIMEHLALLADIGKALG